MRFNENKSVLEKLIRKTPEEEGESQDSQEKIALQLEVIKRKISGSSSLYRILKRLLQSFKKELKIQKKKYIQFFPNHQNPKVLSYQGWGLENSMVTTRSGKHSTIHLYQQWILKPSLSNVEKFNYLRSSLFGDSMAVIEELQLTNKNYDKAMCLLKGRFGNKQSIITAHTNELLMLRRIDNEKIGTQVRSLQSLGVQGENYGTLLVPVILNSRDILIGPIKMMNVGI